MSERALVFGSVADAYERHRLGYPDAVADLTLAYAQSPVATALEVGAGTGKGTRLFAERGVTVTALEPDAATAAVLRRTTAAMPVEVVVSTFEAYVTEGRAYDLLLCAQAWHWMDPATRLDAVLPLGRLTTDARLVPGLWWPGSDLDADQRFADVAEHDVCRVVSRTREDHVSLLGTLSPYLQLPTDERNRLLTRVRTVLPDAVEVDATVRLHLARRV